MREIPRQSLDDVLTHADSGRMSRIQSPASLMRRHLMERVTGIGGFFFPAEHPDGLMNWYEHNLGIRPATERYEDGSWWQDEGPTVFYPHASSARGGRWTLNLRVRDLAAMASQLEGAGIEVNTDPNDYPNGQFARLSDPEGNPIELWEPAGPDLHRPN